MSNTCKFHPLVFDISEMYDNGQIKFPRQFKLTAKSTNLNISR